MMNLKQLFDAGDLSGAIDAATQSVKAQPTNANARTFLFELLCFAGELDRAEKQLGVLGHQDAQSEWGAQVYGNILHAERTRRRVFSQGLKPEFLLDPPDYIERHLEAISRLREGRPDAARQLLEQSEQTRPAIDGQRGGQAFSDFRDCDDLLGPVLELIMLSDYIWVPFEQVREIDVAPPERPRDLIWATVRLTLPDNSQRRGYVPALYPDTYLHADDAVRLGRLTDWKGGEGEPVRGAGLRMFLAGDDAISLFDLKEVQLRPSEGPAQ